VPPEADDLAPTPADRCHELAGLLAAGIRRLRTRAAPTDAPGDETRPGKPPESSQDCLELPGDTGLSVQRS